MKKGSIMTVLLSVGLAFVLLLVAQSVDSNYRIPGNNQGYEPVQPIAYSHRQHAGEFGIECLHCHVGAEVSRTAGIPPAATCLNCHRFITAAFNEVRAEDELASRENRSPRRIVSPELAKIYAAMGLDSTLTRDPSLEERPIKWVKVHALPDYVSFDHRAHVSAGVDCQTCHGEVQTMERVRQVSDLSMGWCVNCHRDANARGVQGSDAHAPTDCVACHH